MMKSVDRSFRWFRQMALFLAAVALLLPVAMSTESRTANARRLLAPAQAGSQKWAVLIGVDAYDRRDISPLRGAANDAEALAKTLKEVGGFSSERILLLTTRSGAKRPERGEILETFSSLETRVRPGDTVFVFFSGHGCQSDGKTYLLPCDVRAGSIPLVRRTALDVEDFEDSLRRLSAARVLIAYDMCRVEVGKDGATTMTPEMQKSVQGKGQDFAGAKTPGAAETATPTGGPVFVRWWSCSPGERSYETDRKDAKGNPYWRGYFSYTLESGLRGQAVPPGTAVTMGALETWVRGQVITAVKNREGREQTPRILLDAGSMADAVSFVLAPGQIPVPAIETIAQPIVTTKDTRAQLKITTNAPNAVISVNGQRVTGGQYVANLAGQEKQTVDVLVTAPGYEAQEMSVEVYKGKLVPLPVRLVKIVPVAVAAPVKKPAPKPVPSGTKIGAKGPTPPPTTNAGFRPPLTLAEYKAQMVLVPAGEFMMGSDDGNRAEKPVHKVSLSAYRIGRTEVTVGMWEEFCKATGRQMPPAFNFNPNWSKKDHPIVHVSWDDAQAYCKWAGLTLPTEAQREKAARGTDGRKYPWSDNWEPTHLWWDKSSFGTKSVGAFPSGASPYGCLDMAGNIWEWCYDYFDNAFYESSKATEPNPMNTTPGNIAGTSPYRVQRGGAWHCA